MITSKAFCLGIMALLVHEICAETIISKNKKTRQKNTAWGGESSRAVDGNTDPMWGGASCTGVSFTREPWLAVDLGQYYILTKFVLYNRKDCCSERLHDVYAGGGNDPEIFTKWPRRKYTPRCGGHPGVVGASTTINCPPLFQARYAFVMIFSLDGVSNDILTLCEVEIYGDPVDFSTPQILSRYQSAQEINMGWSGIASRAVDGNLNRKYNGLSCSHTQLYANPWLMIDLGARFTVTAVELHNREDCCSNRLHDVILGVTDDSSVWTTRSPAGKYATCGVYNGVVPQVGTLTCSTPQTGRYVIISIQSAVGKQDYLTICEAQVKGRPADGSVVATTTLRTTTTPAPTTTTTTRRTTTTTTTTPQPPPPLPQEPVGNLEDIYPDVAKGKNTRAINTGMGYATNLAVDGNTDGRLFSGKSCYMSGLDQQPWFYVDLGGKYKVHGIQIWNTVDMFKDKLKDFNVGVTDFLGRRVVPGSYPTCTHYLPLVNGDAEIRCPSPISGKLVIIQLLDRFYTWLPICEIKVFGEPA